MLRCLPQARKSATSAKRIVRSLSQFRAVEHVVPCQHTRHYLEGAIPGQQNELRLAVKQYIPLDDHASATDPNAVTLIGAHANGFPKELYEPMWEDIKHRLWQKGKKIRSIWIADMATQGQSGVLNESILGTDPSWFDHARDLLFLINQKQADMPQPLIGIGHSVGAAHLAALSLMHPRLLQALVLIDPVIQSENPGLAFAPLSTYRRDLWPSRVEAEASFRKSHFYQKWDPRVLDKWLEYGLRELPTELYPDSAASEDGKVPVTLTTTIAQEVYQYMRPVYKGNPITDKEVYADFDPSVLSESNRFYRPESREICRRLPELYPLTHYIFGADSELATPELRRKKIETTGVGVGGSGGAAANRVSETLLNCGHLVCMERTADCSAVAAHFVDKALDEYAERKQRMKKLWFSMTTRQRLGVDEEWKQNIGPPPARPKRKG